MIRKEEEEKKGDTIITIKTNYKNKKKSKSRMTMNHHHIPPDTSNQLSKNFSSNEGYRIVGTVINDEFKLLQETKKILEKRILLDEQYARNLQDLTANADRVAWPVNTHPIASVKND
jgi:hypothetical protein